jgi:transposase
MVNPMNVKRSKELDDNLPIKHDRIARLIKDGRFSCAITLLISCKTIG